MTASAGPPPRPPHSRGAPPRPDLSVPVPSPFEAVGRPAPSSVTRPFALWVVSGVVCLAVAGYAYTKLEELRPGLREAILAQDPTIATESLDRVVEISQFVAFGAIGVF